MQPDATVAENVTESTSLESKVVETNIDDSGTKDSQANSMDCSWRDGDDNVEIQVVISQLDCTLVEEELDLKLKEEEKERMLVI